MIAATLKITEAFVLSTGLRTQKKLLIIQTDIAIFPAFSR